MVVKLGDEAGDGAVRRPSPSWCPRNTTRTMLKELSGGKDVELKHQDGDYDEFDSPDGNGSWYAAKAPGRRRVRASRRHSLPLSPSRETSAGIGGQRIAGQAFAGGDVGLYVNAASLATAIRRPDRPGAPEFMGALDQAAQQAGNAAAMQMAKDMYGRMFDSLKYADDLTVHLDAAPKGLHLAVFLKVKPTRRREVDRRESERSAPGVPGQDPAGCDGLRQHECRCQDIRSVPGHEPRMINAGGKPSPEIEKAMAEFHGLGRIESHVTSVFVERDAILQATSGSTDPKKYIAATVDDAPRHGRGRRTGRYSTRTSRSRRDAQTDRGADLHPCRRGHGPREAGGAEREPAGPARELEGNVRRLAG